MGLAGCDDGDVVFLWGVHVYVHVGGGDGRVVDILALEQGWGQELGTDAHDDGVACELVGGLVVRLVVRLDTVELVLLLLLDGVYICFRRKSYWRTFLRPLVEQLLLLKKRYY